MHTCTYILPMQHPASQYLTFKKKVIQVQVHTCKNTARYYLLCDTLYGNTLRVNTARIQFTHFLLPRRTCFCLPILFLTFQLNFYFIFSFHQLLSVAHFCEQTSSVPRKFFVQCFGSDGPEGVVAPTTQQLVKVQQHIRQRPNISITKQPAVLFCGSLCDT